MLPSLTVSLYPSEASTVLPSEVVTSTAPLSSRTSTVTSYSLSSSSNAGSSSASFSAKVTVTSVSSLISAISYVELSSVSADASASLPFTETLSISYPSSGATVRETSEPSSTVALYPLDASAFFASGVVTVTVPFASGTFTVSS